MKYVLINKCIYIHPRQPVALLDTSSNTATHIITRSCVFFLSQNASQPHGKNICSIGRKVLFNKVYKK